MADLTLAGIRSIFNLLLECGSGVFCGVRMCGEVFFEFGGGDFDEFCGIAAPVFEHSACQGGACVFVVGRNKAV